MKWFQQDESDRLPFPNDENEFSLPDDLFGSLMESRGRLSNIEEKDVRSRSRSSTRKEDRDDGM